MKLYAEETCLDEIVCGGNLRTFHRSAHCIRNLKVRSRQGAKSNFDTLYSVFLNILLDNDRGGRSGKTHTHAPSFYPIAGMLR
jgi:hypothetical protein